MPLKSKCSPPLAVWTLLTEIGPELERTTGHKLNVINGYSRVFLKQIRAGEPFDVFVSIRPLIDSLFEDGTLIPDSGTNVVRTGTGVEVRAGAAKPDISSVEAFKRAMLNAKSIGYLRIAGVPELMERLGIADAIKSKVTIPETDLVSELVADGKIELGGRPASAGDSNLHSVCRRRKRELESAECREGPDQVH